MTISQFGLIAVASSMLIYTLYTNCKLYKQLYHHNVNQMMKKSGEQISDMLALVDKKTQRKINTIFWGIAVGINWIIIMCIWFLGHHQPAPIPHLIATYMLIWVFITIFDVYAWPTPVNPDKKLTKLNLTISIAGDIAEYLLLSSVIVLTIINAL